MDKKPKTPADDNAPDDRFKQLEATLHEKVLGQEEIKGEILKTLTRKHRPSVILTGSAGMGKTAAMEALAKALAKSLADPPARRRGKAPMDKLAEGFAACKGRQPGCVIIFDEIHTMDKEQLSEAFERAFGLAASIDIGEQAAKACHDGLTESMTPMKPLSLKRGFAYIM